MFLVIICTLLQLSCVSKQKVSAVVVDEYDNPVKGALLYYETYDDLGAFDFGFGYSGEKGEVPPQGSDNLYAEWKPGAKIALAAFIIGKKPAVMYDQLERITPSGMILTLRNLSKEEMKWEPRIAKLSFPFEDNPELFEKVKKGNTKNLIDAFLKAYEMIFTDQLTVFEWETKKYEVLLQLDSLRKD